MSDPKAPSQGDADQLAEMTPEAEYFIARAKRLFGISIAVLLAGFIAVMAALFYRSSQTEATVSVPAAISLPAGAEIISVSASGERVMVTYRTGDLVQIGWFDAKSAELIGTTQIDNE